MNKEEFAKLLHGREIGDEITREEKMIAQESGLVIVYGESDDLTEFEGSISEEMGHGLLQFTSTGQQIPDEDMRVLKKYNVQPEINEIRALHTNAGWKYETQIPHSTFDIMEDGELYCRGIVFSIYSLK